MKWSEIKTTIEKRGVTDNTTITTIIIETEDKRVNVDLDKAENTAVIFGS
jgi:hypothetical protein